MADHDPAVIEALELWKQKRAKDALNLLAQRVNELAAQKPARSGSGTGYLVGLVLGIILAGIIGLGLYIVLGLQAVSEDDQRFLDLGRSFENGTPYLALAESLPIPSLTTAPTNTPTPIPTLTHTPTATYTPAVTDTPVPTNTSSCWIESWWAEADPLVIQFLDTTEVAVGTSRISLSPVLLDLRQVYRQFEGTNYPPCAKEIRDDLSDGMSHTIEGLQKFLEESEYLSAFKLDLATESFRTAYDALLNQGIVPDFRLYNTGVLIW